MMNRARFTTELALSPYGADSWILLQPLKYLPCAHAEKIEAKKGFLTDLASIPRIIRPLFPVHGLHTRAAVIHDWLYHDQRIGNQWIKRAEADWIFYEAMRGLGVSWMKARTMYYAVRSAGWIFWNRRARALGNEVSK